MLTYKSGPQAFFNTKIQKGPQRETVAKIDSHLLFESLVLEVQSRSKEFEVKPTLSSFGHLVPLFPGHRQRVPVHVEVDVLRDEAANTLVRGGREGVQEFLGLPVVFLKE